MLLATAASTGTAIMQGEQQKDWADYQSDQAKADAVAERKASILEAEKIRKLAKKQRSEATAALAASGANVGEGTAVLIDQDIAARGEQDALMSIFNDSSSQLLTESNVMKQRGKQAQTAGYLNAGSTALEGGYEYKSKWKTKKELSPENRAWWGE